MNETSHLTTDPQSTFTQLILALSTAMDLDEKVKLYHGWQVAVWASKMAEEACPQQLTEIFYAGLLHDIGGIGLSDHIIHWPRLDDQLKNPEVRSHPYRGAQIIRMIPVIFKGLHHIADMVLEHHEWWTGKGYPNGKSGDEIGKEAQLLRAADAFDVYRRLYPKPVSESVDSALDRLASSQECSSQMVHLLKKILGKEDPSALLRDHEALADLIRQMQDRLPPLVLQDVSDTLEGVLLLFAKVIDAKHSYTAGHSERIALYSSQIARALGLPDDQVREIRYAGYLHDIGKLSVPRSILDKPGPLDEEERRLVKNHPRLTIEVLKFFPALRGLAQIAGRHHERWDGQGYPDGLKGEEIPLGGRILAVADALDALTSDRPYREIGTFKEALQDMRAGKSKQFDPRVVDATVELFG
ncbi:MAG: 3'3'-cGAMP-specific phosphodiesterase 3 [Actinobacteria bacterium]|nr:3'3'-cGAMP-specific phosphodiesterase 3 [Actinomycetota bacterium]